MPYPDVPHFSFPFSVDFAGRRPSVRDQDSGDEIADCVEVLLSTEIGERIDEPEYGIEDQAFRQGGVDTQYLEGVVAEWEPRADIEFSDLEFEGPGDLVQRARMEVTQRGDV